MSDFYFKKSKSRGKEYMQVHHKEKGYLCSLGDAEKAYKDSVMMLKLIEQTEYYRKLLTEIGTGKR